MVCSIPDHITCDPWMTGTKRIQYVRTTNRGMGAGYVRSTAFCPLTGLKSDLFFKKKHQ
jgi:hypothetical protein